MIQLQELLKPTWGVEKWLNSAWSILNSDEKKGISKRVDEMFYNPIPFQLEYSKTLYIHLFSLLAQLEIFGLQGMIKSLDKLPKGELQNKLRLQIIDEIFHSIVFSKITYELSAPYAQPPTHSEGIEHFLSLLVNEPDLKTAVVLINLVAEGWIGEIFMAMQRQKVAPRVFDVVHEDENRHLEDFAIFRAIGLPDQAYLKEKLAAFEEELTTMVFSQNTYVQTLISFLGVNGAKELFDNIDKKHHEMLKKIDCTPSKKWQFFMKNIAAVIQEVFHDQSQETVVPQTSTRKLFTAIWAEPNLPTQSSIFSLDVTPVQFFEKKFGPETITGLSLQALSKAMFNNPILKNYMSNLRLYNPQDSYVGVAVLLPNSNHNLGIIEFKNCHDMPLSALAQHIQHDMQIMDYCYKRTEELKQEHAYIRDIFTQFVQPRSENIYMEPLITRPTISLSNVGQWGYEAPISPLFPNEAVKLTLAKIERKQVWNNKTKQFEVRDILPVGISVDHRVFDGNIPVPYMMQAAFDEVFARMLQDAKAPQEPVEFSIQLDEFIRLTEKLLQEDLDLGCRYLFFSAQVWKNHNEAKTFLSQVPELDLDESVEA